MKKFSYSLVLLCIAVSFLLLTCNPEVEGAAPMGPGSINVAKRSRSEFFHSRRSICEAARALNCLKDD